MVCYVNFLSATSPDTMDGSPARWIALIHQLHIAGEEGGSATMVAVFLPVLVCCGWLLHLFELVVCRKMVQNGRLSVVNAVTFWPTYACTIPGTLQGSPKMQAPFPLWGTISHRDGPANYAGSHSIPHTPIPM
jgi:hypothetical protein